MTRRFTISGCIVRIFMRLTVVLESIVFFFFSLTQRNGPLSAREKSFCENYLDSKRISFGIKYIALEAKN